MTFEAILEEINEIAEYCACHYDKSNGEELSDRLTNLNVYLSRSAVLQANAEELLDFQRAEETSKLLEGNYSPSVITNLVKGKVSRFMRLYRLCERLNASITHQQDSVRSQLSYLKAIREN